MFLINKRTTLLSEYIIYPKPKKQLLHLLYIIMFKILYRKNKETEESLSELINYDFVANLTEGLFL